MTAACPWCNAPRAEGLTCPRCGANYAKAEQIKAHGRAPAVEQVATVPVPATLVGMEERVVEDPAREFKLSVAALPAMLALGLAFHAMTPGLQRIFFGMPVHELGHAVTAWFCGYFAVPTLWRTLVAEERGFIAPLVLAGFLGWIIYRAWLAEKLYIVVLGAVLLVLQGIGTFGIGEHTAEMLFAFGGDGMGMVLATALMCTFFFGKRTQLYKGWLRWGFLAIGAAAFTDMFATWWTGEIPFGEIEGVGLSDPMKLVEEHGWTAKEMVRRYVSVGVACLAALALVYAWGVRRAWRLAQP
jgi:hypothetical protein